MPPKKKKGKSTRTRSATVSDATRRLILQNQYSNAIGRTRSAKGAINAKKKRKKLLAELEALSREDGIEWIKMASKKRRVSRPMTAIRRTREALLKQKQKDSSSSSSVDKLVKLIDALEEAVKPLLVETQKYIESAKESKDRLEKTMQRGVDIDRALLDACGAVFDIQTNYFYATPESQENILPASVFQLSKWHQNTAMKRSNSATGKVSSKNEAQGKRHATMARQDTPDSIVEHRPECV